MKTLYNSVTRLVCIQLSKRSNLTSVIEKILRHKREVSSNYSTITAIRLFQTRARVYVQHLQYGRRFVWVAETIDGRVGVVRRRSVSGATARAGRMSDVRDDRGTGPGQAVGVGRAVAGLSADRGHRSQGTVDGRAVWQDQPAGRGVLRVPSRGDRGGRDGPRAGRTTERGARGPRVHGTHPLPVGRG